jgi:hypothetical protein
MNYPDEDLPELQLSLRQFVAIAGVLHAREQDSDAFVRFVLAGRWKGHRIFINSRQDAAAPPKGQYIFRRDFDSAIGVTRDLPFIVPLAVFPVASFRDTLTTDNHIKYNPRSLSNSNVSIVIKPHETIDHVLSLAESCWCAPTQNSQYRLRDGRQATSHSDVLSLFI